MFMLLRLLDPLFSWRLYAGVLSQWCLVMLGPGTRPSACRSISLQLEQATAHPVSPGLCGLPVTDRTFLCPSTENGKGDPVLLNEEADRVRLGSCSVS